MDETIRLKICSIILFLILGFYTSILSCQTKKYQIRTIAFYNVENLFDTIDDPLTADDDYTLRGKNQYSATNYFQKIKLTAKVISEIRSDKHDMAPAIIGLAEIENIGVLKDLVHNVRLKKNEYQIVHKDSPDRRGIDVALLYQQEIFSPIKNEFIEVRIWNEKNQRIFTRDILYVYGLLDGERLHLLVNHWPSRRGGKDRSDPKRLKAAYLVKQKTDQILAEDPLAKILIMGDFNDDPTDDSIKIGLLTPSILEKDIGYRFLNPMSNMHKKGMNTLAYRDNVNLFDQIILSENLKKSTENGLFFYKAGIYNPTYLITKHGKYKGYPLRSFENNRFRGGYSDHFPVYIELLKSFSD